MRIHSPDVSLAALPDPAWLEPWHAWQITGRGVHRVLIRHIRDAQACISRFVGHVRAPGKAAGFALNTSLCLVADLFETEVTARAEHHRRRKLTHSATDRRMRIVPALPAAAE